MTVQEKLWTIDTKTQYNGTGFVSDQEFLDTLHSASERCKTKIVDRAATLLSPRHPD